MVPYLQYVRPLISGLNGGGRPFFRCPSPPVPPPGKKYGARLRPLMEKARRFLPICLVGELNYLGLASISLVLDDLVKCIDANKLTVYREATLFRPQRNRLPYRR